MGSIGFIGLGIMGNAMALNLVSAGEAVVVWNRTMSRADEVVAAGASLASSPADVARSCDVVFLCVSDTPDVDAVVFGEGGVAEGLSVGGLIVDHSTISPSATQEFAKRTNAAGAHWLDAPVSGGSEGAAKGTLSIMVGGDADQLERVLPYLQVTVTRQVLQDGRFDSGFGPISGRFDTATSDRCRLTSVGTPTTRHPNGPYAVAALPTERDPTKPILQRRRVTLRGGRGAQDSSNPVELLLSEDRFPHSIDNLVNDSTLLAGRRVLLPMSDLALTDQAWVQQHPADHD